MSRACRNGLLPKLKELVKLKHFSSSKVTKFVELASQRGHIEVIKYLFALGPVDVNHVVGMAIEGNHIDIVKCFFNLGADISFGGHYFFIKACYFGHLEMAKYLVGVGADITTYSKVEATFRSHKSPKYNYPIRIACKNNHDELMEYLISLVLNEMKKYTMLLLFNNGVLCKDLIPFILLTEYKKQYKYYQEFRRRNIKQFIFDCLDLSNNHPKYGDW